MYEGYIEAPLALQCCAIVNRYADPLSNLTVYPMKHAVAYFYKREGESRQQKSVPGYVTAKYLSV